MSRTTTDDVQRDGRQLLGVYEDQARARRAVEGAGRAGGGTVRVGDPADRVASLRAEMRAETEDGFILPQAGLLVPKESARGLAVSVPIAMVAGALVIGPVGLFDFGWTLGTRLALAAGIGAAMGAVIAFIVGAATAARGRFEANAADRGVTVRVSEDTEAVERAMVAAGPIRLDRLGPDGTPEGVVATEADRGEHGTVATMVGHVRAAPHVAGRNDEADPDYDPDDPATSPSVESS